MVSFWQEVSLRETQQNPLWDPLKAFFWSYLFQGYIKTSVLYIDNNTCSFGPMEEDSSGCLTKCPNLSFCNPIQLGIVKHNQLPLNPRSLAEINILVRVNFFSITVYVYLSWFLNYWRIYSDLIHSDLSGIPLCYIIVVLTMCNKIRTINH